MRYRFFYIIQSPFNVNSNELSKKGTMDMYFYTNMV